MADNVGASRLLMCDCSVYDTIRYNTTASYIHCVRKGFAVGLTFANVRRIKYLFYFIYLKISSKGH